MKDASATPVQCERAAKVTLHPRLPNKAFEKSHVWIIFASWQDLLPTARLSRGRSSESGFVWKWIVRVYGPKNDIFFIPEWVSAAVRVTGDGWTGSSAFLWISSSKRTSDHFYSASMGALLWLFLEVVGGFGHTFARDAG